MAHSVRLVALDLRTRAVIGDTGWCDAFYEAVFERTEHASRGDPERLLVVQHREQAPDYFMPGVPMAEVFARRRPSPPIAVGAPERVASSRSPRRQRDKHRERHLVRGHQPFGACVAPRPFVIDPDQWRGVLQWNEPLEDE